MRGKPSPAVAKRPLPRPAPQRSPVRVQQPTVRAALAGQPPASAHVPARPGDLKTTPPIPPAQPAAAAAPAAPDIEPGGVNPYTGQKLGAGEYVGVAGSEATHPGMTRIPPPGWWNPSSPYYERRNYYTDASGNVVAREAGFFDPSHPYNTGRGSERNTEYESRPGTTSIRYSEPGVPQWGPGQQAPDLSKLPVPSVSGGGAVASPHVPASVRDSLAGPQQLGVDPSLIRAALSGNAPPTIPQALLDYIRSLYAGQQQGYGRAV